MKYILAGVCTLGLAVASYWLIPAAHQPTPQPTDTESESSSVTSGGKRKIIFIGDSITAGYGIPQEKAFPSLLETKLRDHGLPVAVVNAGISGSTSASGSRRLKWLLKSDPEFVMLQLGGNDGLRGSNLKNTKKNLKETIQLAKQNQITIILVGMKIPPNYGPEYTRRFAALYDEIADEEGIPYIPFVFEKYRDKKSLFLPDGIHPNVAGHAMIAEEMLPYLKKLL